MTTPQVATMSKNVIFSVEVSVIDLGDMQNIKSLSLAAQTVGETIQHAPNHLITYQRA